MSETATISTLAGDGSFSAYVARPAREPRAAILVIQESFGVNAGIRGKCDRLAADGYLRFDQDQGVADIEATIRHARHALGVEKVGVVGYCLGGRLAYMVAARTDADASVGYYAVGVPDLLREKHGIANPLMLHLAGADHFVPPQAQAAIHDGLDDHPKATLHDYPGMDHGFATEIGARRSEDAANLADSRSAAFFAEHLG